MVKFKEFWPDGRVGGRCVGCGCRWMPRVRNGCGGLVGGVFPVPAVIEPGAPPPDPPFPPTLFGLLPPPPPPADVIVLKIELDP